MDYIGCNMLNLKGRLLQGRRKATDNSRFKQLKSLNNNGYNFDNLAESKPKPKPKQQKKKKMTAEQLFKQKYEETWKQQEKERMIMKYFQNKGLDPKKLQEMYEPIKVLDEEKRTIRTKVATKISNSTDLFNAMVNKRFPPIHKKENRPPVKSPYGKKHNLKDKLLVLDDYFGCIEFAAFVQRLDFNEGIGQNKKPVTIEQEKLMRLRFREDLKQAFRSSPNKTTLVEKREPSS